jgi:hypothetical protein
MTRPRSGHKRRPWRPYRLSRTYGFVRSRQLDATMERGSRHGSYCLTAARVMMGWGTVADARWPTPGGKVAWPPPEPPGFDRIARFNRTGSHWRVRTLDDLRRAVFSGGFCNFSVPITKQWYSASNGLIALPTSPSDFVAGHAMLAIGYNDETQLIKFINNWGPQWGDRGCGYLPYSYFEKYCSDALTTFPQKLQNWCPDRTGEFFITRTSMFTNSLGYAAGLIDLWQLDEDIRIGWCLLTWRGDVFLDIEDFFIRPDFQTGAHQRVLTEKVLELAQDNALPLRLWIAHADTAHYASNFAVMNELLRAIQWQVRRSPYPWAAYVAEQV